MIARVRGEIARFTRAGSTARLSGSTSTNTGVAPAMRIVEVDAMNEKAGVMTSSPGPTPSAARAMRRASVPEPTPIAWRTPHSAATSRSRVSPSGPRMNREESSTRSIARRRSAFSAACCRTRSTRGIIGPGQPGRSSEGAQARAEAADPQEIHGEAKFVVALVARDILQRYSPALELDVDAVAVLHELPRLRIQVGLDARGDVA